MRICVLGPVQAFADDDAAVDLGGAKQRAVLAQLALQPNLAVPLDRLAEGVWGSQVPARHRQTLQVYVSNLRRTLEPGRAGRAPSRIIGHREAYELVAAPTETDAGRFSAAAREGREALTEGRPLAAAARLAEGLAEWRGAPLADLADQPFAGDWTTRLLEERTSAVEDRMAADLACGRSGDLVPELSDLVRTHPERERFWGQLMLALYRSGRQGEALGAFRQARETLVEETGLDPGPQLSGLADRILHQGPGLPASAPRTSMTSTIPLPLTPVIGEGAPVRAVLEAVRGGARLVTLTGAGGVGKTRACLAAAQALVTEGRPLVWLPLEELRVTDLATAAIAQGLGVSDLEQDAAQLAGRRDVLLLDNLEQLPDLAPRLRLLLEQAPTLQVIATSRSPLALRGERVVEVAPLDVSTYAVQLFAERAADVVPGFDLEAHRCAVGRICAALDGLPLAVELAGAHLLLYSPEDLAEELAAGAGVAAVGDDEGRQGSMVALVGWSLDLLTAPARRLLALVAAVPGAVDLDTVVAVGEVAGLAADHTRRAVDQLLRSALLRAVETDAGRRFTLLNTVRAVAATELGEEDAPTVLDAVAGVWVRRAGAVDPLRQPDRRRLAAASADLPLERHVLARLGRTGRTAEAARILFADRRALAAIGRADLMLAMALDLLDVDPPEPDRSVLRVLGGGAAYQCRNARADDLLSAVDDLPADQVALRVLGHTWRCVSSADAGDEDHARRHADLALASAASSGSPPLLGLAHSAAGWAALRRADYEDAAGHARAQVSAASDDHGRVLAHLDLALALLFAEATTAAVDLLGDTLTLARRLGPSVPHTLAQAYLGWALLQADEAPGALSSLLAALRSMGDSSDPGLPIETAAAIGLAACLLGERTAGRRLIQQANAFAAQNFGVDCALPDPVVAVAVRHGVDISHDPAVPPVGTTADLVDRAVASGASWLAAAVVA